ncbi:MAG: hypothetical protein WBP81_13265 [Solirubrobacteraceae bacterium]
MTRPAAQTLLEAVERDRFARHEDRLTEVLACALWTLPDLARWFITDAAGASAPSPGGIPKIRTQGLLGGNGQPDMEITYRSVSGPACILSEQKVDADLSQYQRAGYPGWVRDKLVLVAPDTEKYRRAPQFDAHISWLRIAQEMHRIAARRGQSAWREKALLPEEPSVLRFLHEVLSFIERQDVGVSGMDPIDGKVIDAYRRLESVRGTLLTFLRMIRADERIRALEPTPIGSAKHETYWWFSLERPDWPFLRSLDRDSVFEICLQPEVDFLDEEGTAPILSAGFSFFPENGAVPEVLIAPDSLVASALHGLGAKVGMRENRRQGKCAVPLPLAHIAATGGTLVNQAHHAAGWAVDALLRMSRISSP